jgi:hypothetical protein
MMMAISEDLRIMRVEQFIEEQVNNSRGGYRPHEVAQLIRLAWQHAKIESLNDARGKLDDSLREAGRAYSSQWRPQHGEYPYQFG